MTGPARWLTSSLVVALIVLTVIGSVLVFVQLGLAIQMILNALTHLGVIQG